MLPSYIAIIMNNYKDPYSPTSIMESSRGFCRGSDDEHDEQNEQLVSRFVGGKHLWMLLFSLKNDEH